jgi:hypothetical protein
VQVKASIIPKLVDICKEPAHRDVVLKLLYHISMDDRCKSMFTYTDAVPLVLKLVVEAPSGELQRELVALAVNLCANARNAEIMCACRPARGCRPADGVRGVAGRCQHGLPELVARTMRTHDVLLLKLVRTIAQHDFPAKKLFNVPRLLCFRCCQWHADIDTAIRGRLCGDGDAVAPRGRDCRAAGHAEQPGARGRLVARAAQHAADRLSALAHAARCVCLCRAAPRAGC